MRTRAVVFPEVCQASLVTEDLRDPAAGELLVETTCSLISTGTEMICYHGACDADTHWAQYLHYPHRPGYSLVGRVAAAGDGAAEMIGKRVTCTVSHRSHALVTPKQVWGEIPEEVSDQEAAWGSLAVITQTGVRMAEHVMGDSAVVIGLGPLGQLVIRYLRLLGLQQILAVDPVASRLELATRGGATATLAGEASAAKDFVLEHTEGRLADVVYDVTGHWAVLPTALPLARDHGKLVLLGDSPFPSKQCLTYDVVSRQVRIIGSRSSWLPPEYASWTPQRMTGLFFDYLRRGQMSVSELISHRFPAEQAAEVYALLAERLTETMGVLLQWSEPAR